VTVSCPSCGHEEKKNALATVPTGLSGTFYKCPDCHEITRDASWKTSTADD
jgi:predicted RNA-binding Zn-ribbon protein involved in translation (DUF1610 family)